LEGITNTAVQGADNFLCTRPFYMYTDIKSKAGTFLQRKTKNECLVEVEMLDWPVSLTAFAYVKRKFTDF
jgi:hypothetical protein